VAATAAPAATTSAVVAPDPIDDELVREARARLSRRFGRRERLGFALSGIAALAAGVATALFLHAGAPFHPLTVALFVLVYAAVLHVEFEIGPGSAFPTQLVLVPMLFAIPLGAVPLAVAAAFVLRRLTMRKPLTLERLLPLFGNSSHALGPVLVLAVAGGTPLRWSAWPVYALALGAQFAFDFGNAAGSGHLAHGTPIRTVARFMRWTFVVDASLAPVGLAIAFATRTQPALVVLVLPLVGLLRHFAHERQRRIDHALELSAAYRGTAFLLGDVVEADDAYTGTHSRHVVDLVLSVCDELGLSADDRRDAEFVALLHDVGKIRIPSSIINKPGPLDADERAIINTHTIEGERMLEQVGGLLGHVGRLVRSCHEDWDGSGYPDGLAGEQIPLVARIVCACDAFSAMTTDRPYRRARTDEEALAELERCAGTQFDARVVEVLVRVAARDLN
jgi:HD-GYP domain-containing protein (c-di-GMP phosphodiesterase class II)